MPATRREPFGSNPRVGERGAITHRKILESALEIFGTRGFHETQVEMITAAAGCSRPAFYQYFSSKEDVFWRLARDLTNAMDDLSNQIGKTTNDVQGVEQIKPWFEGLIEIYSVYSPIFLLYPSAVRERTRTSTAARGVSDRIGRRLLPAPKRGTSEALKTYETSVSLVLPVLLRSTHYWLTGLGQISRTRFVESSARTLHRLQHGPIEGVNLGKTGKPLPKENLAWPVLPSVKDELVMRSRGKETRQLLLSAGTSVLPRLGYHDTRVDDIVAAAGVSHGTFYRYFKNKEDLFHVLAQQAALTMGALLNEFPDKPASLELDRWLDRWLNLYWANGGVISAWQEIGSDDPELAKFSTDFALAVFDQLCRIVQRRGFGDQITDGLMLLALIERVPYSAKSFGRISRDSTVKAMTIFVRRGLLGFDGV